MDKMYTIELSGKDISLLCDSITERINSNNEISKYTNKNLSCKNRSLNRLRRYLLSIKQDEDYMLEKQKRQEKKLLKKQRKENKKCEKESPNNGREY